MRILLPLLLLATPALAHEYRVSGITIDHPFAYATEGPTAEGYVILVNEGATDTLLKVTGDNGVSLTAPVPLPAGQATELLPGGLHIDFAGLTAPWAEGDQISATLVFENAGEVPVVFYVEARP
ncbi:MAG: copper chaperone PCu(A)C [Pseudomonadota bacterium]